MTTKAQLQNLVNILNEKSGQSHCPIVMTDSGHSWNIGNYHISQAYGGYALHQVYNEFGGIVDIFGRGHMPKKKLGELLDNLIRNI